jgi:4-hydroxy-3-polyprenylbenzoate decarboxylase
MASRMLIDATLKWPHPPTSLPKKEYVDRALVLWRELKLPPLKLKEPVYGLNLGFWTDEWTRLAGAAAKGDQYAAGEAYFKQRRKAS